MENDSVSLTTWFDKENKQGKSAPDASGSYMQLTLLAMIAYASTITANLTRPTLDDSKYQ